MKIFIPVAGQFTNIGDTLHRKILISWLKKESVQLHVFVGKAPQSFIEALGLRDSDIIYTNYFKWAFYMLGNSIKEKTGFFFNPGELTMSTKRLILELGLIPFHLFIKLRKGKVIRVGVAAKSDINIRFKSLWDKILSLSNKIYWRTEKSNSIFTKGIVIPDLAFYDVDSMIDFSKKNKLVLSMRGDRTAPNDEWYEAVKAFSHHNNLEIIVVSQVRIDNNRTKEISNKLNAKSYIWEDTLSHNEQEEILNDLYRESKIAISDRLHVLIAAFTKGVIPTNLAISFSNKVQDHFDVVGLENVTINSNNTTKEDILVQLNTKLNQGFDNEVLNNAKMRLESVRLEINNLCK